MPNSVSETPVIQIINLNKNYKTAAGAIDALKDVNLTIRQGELAAVVGKSGSGKSTLMNLIAGIDKPTSGEIFFNHILLKSMNENQMAKWRGTSIGIVFQFFQLLPTLTVLENIILPMDFRNTFPMKQRRERAFDLLRLVGIEDQADKFPAALSGGQQQRAAIARALANDPSIILADEPTGNLDSSTAGEIFELFRSLAHSGKTVIIVTHDQDLAGRCSRIVRLFDGRLA